MILNDFLFYYLCIYRLICLIFFYRKGKVVKALIRQFQPYLKLVDANAVKVGTCLTGAVPPVPTHGGPDNNRADGSSDTIFHGIIPSADYLLTFIIPAVIITCMLILAILLACMLHKKRKAGTCNNIV